jgi:hypothetical protein
LSVRIRKCFVKRKAAAWINALREELVKMLIVSAIRDIRERIALKKLLLINKIGIIKSKKIKLFDELMNDDSLQLFIHNKIFYFI